MKALLIDNVAVREIDIENTLKAFQEAVDGYIENVTLIPDKAAMIVNEEGRLRGMGLNLIATALVGHIIVGPALIVGINEEKYTDIPEIVSEYVQSGGKL